MKITYNSKEAIDQIAAVLFFLEDVAMGCVDEGTDWGLEDFFPEFDSFDSAKEYYFSLVAELDSPPWANGGHYDDCTKASTPCIRCQVEEYRGYAKEWLDWFRSEGSAQKGMDWNRLKRN